MKEGYEPEDREKAAALVAALTDWYHKNSRALVWRTTRDPYAIWVSEIMAQQTRISAVLPYYTRFLSRFPTLEALAQASTGEVLKTWEGLGYYSRAHNLLKTARIITEEYGGCFPQDMRALRKLPGIGDYTAGAIASICFQQPEPAVDGNVARVFARIYANSLDISLTGTKKRLTAFIRDLMPPEQPGAFNQSLMELGALVCVPKNPTCGDCPVSGLCRAYTESIQSELPVKSQKSAPQRLEKTVLLILNPAGEVLLRRRTGRLLHGLWEFCTADGAMTMAEVRDYLQALGFTAQTIVPVGEAVHTFTHLQWHMTGFCCNVTECELPERSEADGYAFMAAAALENGPAIPAAFRFYREWLSAVGKPAILDTDTNRQQKRG